MEINEHEYKLLLLGKVIRILIKEIRDSRVGKTISRFDAGTIAGYEDVLNLLEDDIETLQSYGEEY